MPEIGTSGLMSGDGKRGVGQRPSYRAHPRLYQKRHHSGWASALGRQAAGGAAHLLGFDPGTAVAAAGAGMAAPKLISKPLREVSMLKLHIRCHAPARQSKSQATFR
jgi:hypothetical protein